MAFFFFLLFLVLSSASAFGTSFFHFRYEESLPLMSAGIVLILFLAGIVGALSCGVIAVIIISLLFYIGSIVKMIKGKKISSFCRDFFTPGFFVFLLSYIALIYFNYDHLAYKWDEFSHWADIVKVMTEINDFGASPMSNSLFKSYPPAMALFQYFYQSMGRILIADYNFTDWLLFHSYQVFFLTFVLPLAGWEKNKNAPVSVLIYIVIILSPLAFFPDFYSSLYIDAMLGVLSACGLFSIGKYHENKKYNELYLCCVCSMLVLAKDAGLCFAIFILLAFICVEVKIDKENKRYIKAVVLGCFVFVPKLLWGLELHKTHAPISFGGRVDIGTLARVIAGKDSSYRSDVLKNFWQALFLKRCVTLSIFDVSLTYVVLFILFVLLLFVSCHFAKKSENGSNPFKISVYAVIAQTIVYVFGICVAYIFKFTEYEALKLASFERYTNIGFLSLWMTIILVISYLISKFEKNVSKTIFILVLCAITLISTPWKSVSQIVSRDEVNRSQLTRGKYLKICENINRCAHPGDSVCLISQGDQGYDYWLVRYSVRPVNVSGKWSIGKAFYSGDVWTLETSAEKWKNVLLSNYDFVALYRINDYFIDEFGKLFCDISQIKEGAVYSVLPDGKLSLCK